MAQHYLHRFGSDDTRSNSTRAGVYLLAAAELGDSNAQQMRLGGGREMVGKWGGWEGTGITWRINGVVLLHHIYTMSGQNHEKKRFYLVTRNLKDMEGKTRFSPFVFF